MKLPITILFICLISVGYSQDFGCFDDPVTGYESVVFSTRSQVNDDSLLWIQYSLPKTNDGYCKVMWNKYQTKMEGSIFNGKKNGLWKFFLKNEYAFYQGNYTDDKKDGEWKRFDVYKNDTTLTMKGFYYNDIKEGKFIYYTQDTVAYEILNYKGGKLDGENIYYRVSSNSTKRIESITNYKEGKQNGTEKEFQSDNRGKSYLYRISEYSNGKHIGQSMEFSIKGDTMSVTDYSNGNDYGNLKFQQKIIANKLMIVYRKRNDTIIHLEYTDSRDTIKYEISGKNNFFGKIYMQDTVDKKWKTDKTLDYSNGLTYGSYKKYYRNGQLAYEILLKKGMPFTAVCAFSIDGKRLEPGTLKEGTGILNFYYPDGVLKSSITYNNSACYGRIISYYKNASVEIEGTMFNTAPSSVILSEYTDDDINSYILHNNLCGDIKCFYENKTLMSVIKYDTTSKKTSLKYFYNNGNPSYTFSEIKNKKIGEYASYYENGNLESAGKCIITKDSISKMDSIWNYYYKEGSLRASINYYSGRKIDSSKYYDKTGKLRRIEVIENSGVHYSIFDGDTVNYTDKSGLKQGKWISLPYSYVELCNDIPNGIEYYKNGKPTGIWESTPRYYDMGKVKYIWGDSTLASSYEYDNNDRLKAEGEIIEPDTKFGLWKEYNSPEGYLKAEGQYYLDRKVGKWKIYKKNGKVRKIINYDKNS